MKENYIYILLNKTFDKTHPVKIIYLELIWPTSLYVLLYSNQNHINYSTIKCKIYRKLYFFFARGKWIEHTKFKEN